MECVQRRSFVAEFLASPLDSCDLQTDRDTRSSGSSYERIGTHGWHHGRRAGVASDPARSPVCRFALFNPWFPSTRKIYLATATRFTTLELRCPRGRVTREGAGRCVQEHRGPPKLLEACAEGRPQKHFPGWARYCGTRSGVRGSQRTCLLYSCATTLRRRSTFPGPCRIAARASRQWTS